MSLSQKTFYKLLLFFFPFLFCCIALNLSCNNSAKPEQTSKDSSLLYTLPEPFFLPSADSARIANTCRLWFDSVLRSRGFSGGIIVARGGQILFEKYSGTGHKPGNDPITKHTPLHIASITKTFTAMAVLKLWQDGKLNIDDTLIKYFPAFNYPGVTIRSLLNHRSGLPNYNYFMQALGWDENRYVSNEDVLNYLVTRKAALSDILPANTHFAYCNTNYALLALLIENVSGLKYAEYLKQTFFIPLQMNDSYVFSMADTATAIPSYNWQGRLEAFNFLDQVYGDKNVYTTPRDLLTWHRALSSNILFTKETLDQAYTPYSNEKPGMRNYGLGWRMNIFPDGKKIIYHNGWWHGSNATFIRLIEENATIIVLGNKFTRSVYQAKVLAGLFGNYYSPFDDEESGTLNNSVFFIESNLKTDSLKMLKTDVEK